MRIVEGDLRDPKIIELLQFHVTTAAAQTAPGSAHALDASGLASPDAEFWAAWNGETLLGFAALKQLTPEHGEIKSMHVVESQRRKGAGTARLDHLIARAHAKGLCRLSLETGSWDYFRPAQTPTTCVITAPHETCRYHSCGAHPRRGRATSHDSCPASAA